METVKAKIIIDREVCARLAEWIKPVMSGGHVAVFADTPLANAVYDAKSSMLSSDYKVSALTLDVRAPFSEKLDALRALPEYIRLFVGIGGGEAAELAKIAAGERGALCVPVAAAPSSESFIAPATAKGVFKAPVMVLADKTLIAAAPARLIASGAGLMYSAWITFFDLRYEEYLSGEENPSTQKLKKLLVEFDGVPKDADFPNRLCEYLMRLGIIKQDIGVVGAADAAGQALAYSVDLYQGEAAFVSAYAIAFLYRAYLKNTVGVTDTLLPADKIKTRKLLQKKFGVNYFAGLTSADFAGHNNYFKHSFIVGEYRADLLAAAELFDMREKQRAFRRMYDDAGFALKAKLSVKELLRAVSLSGEIAEGTFLKQMKDIGFLEHCL